MALPASGQLKVSDIRTELQLTSLNNFSFAQAAYSSYVQLNAYSPAIPPSSGQIDMSDWYSYCHTCANACGATTYYSTTGEYIVIDLGTSSGYIDYSGYADGCGCLIGGTEIEIENGKTIPIEEIFIGQKVFNGKTYNHVVGKETFQTDKIYKFNGGLLVSSESHNHYVKTSEKEGEVKKSNELKVGNIFFDRNLEEILITKIEVIEGTFEVFNIEIDGDQLYVANNLITHNKCSNPCWRLFIGYPYNSSGTLVGTPFATGNSSTFSGTYSYVYSGEKKLYFLPSCIGNHNITVSCPQYTVDWSFGMNSISGTFTIDVNGSNVVYETSSNSGSFKINPGDYVYTSVYGYCDDPTPLYDNNLVIQEPVGNYLSSQCCDGSSSYSYGTWYPSDNVDIFAQTNCQS